MRACRLFWLVFAGALLALGVREATACHVVKVVLQQSGDKIAGVYEYTPDGIVRAVAPSQGDPSAQSRQRNLTPEENRLIWSAVQSLAGYMGKIEDPLPGSTASLDLSWDTGQKARLAWPASGVHTDPQAQSLLEQLLKARPATQ